jgi:hypothetical protein
MSAIFYAVGAVSGVVSLVAFGYACLTVIKLGRDRADARILQGTDDARKAEVVYALRDRLRLDTQKLTKAQTYELAKLELDRQSAKEKRQFILLALGLLLSFGVAAYSVNAARGPVDLTFRTVTADDGKTAYSDQLARVTVALPSGIRTADFTKDGQAVIKGVPREYLGTAQPVTAEVYFYKQKQPDERIALSVDVMTIAMVYSPEGTPEGKRSKSVANLMLLKLLTPYRVISAKAGLAFGETVLVQYCDPKFQKVALTVDLNAPLSKLSVDLNKAFDVLTEQEPSAVPRPADTLGELLERSAVGFKTGVNLLSRADPLAMAPRIRRQLNVLTESNFVEIAASGAKLSFANGRLHEGFTSDLCHAVKSVADENVLNPFAQFYRM